MDDQVTQYLTQQRLMIHGLEDAMSRPSLAARIVQRLVSGAEGLNLRYSAVGNPPVYDKRAFPWAREVEAERGLIRSELERVLDRKDDLPAFHEIVFGVRSISRDRNWKTYLFAATASASGRLSGNALRPCAFFRRPRV